MVKYTREVTLGNIKSGYIEQGDLVLKKDDVVQCEVENIGVLENRIG